MSAGVSDVVTMVPFDLTYVRYEKGDMVGLLLAGKFVIITRHRRGIRRDMVAWVSHTPTIPRWWLFLLLLHHLLVSYSVLDVCTCLLVFVPVVTLTPVFVMVMYATIILTRRDFQTCFICLGQLINVAINLVLKKIISQPRPEDRCVDLSLWFVLINMFSTITIPFFMSWCDIQRVQRRGYAFESFAVCLLFQRALYFANMASTKGDIDYTFQNIVFTGTGCTGFRGMLLQVIFVISCVDILCLLTIPIGMHTSGFICITTSPIR